MAVVAVRRPDGCSSHLEFKILKAALQKRSSRLEGTHKCIDHTDTNMSGTPARKIDPNGHLLLPAQLLCWAATAGTMPATGQHRRQHRAILQAQMRHAVLPTSRHRVVKRNAWKHMHAHWACAWLLSKCVLHARHGVKPTCIHMASASEAAATPAARMTSTRHTGSS